MRGPGRILAVLAALGLCGAVSAAAHEDHARTLAELERRIALEPRDGRWSLARASLLRHVGRSAAAVAETRRAVELCLGRHELEVAARLELARALADAGRPAGASAALASLLLRAPTEPEAHELAARLALLGGERGSALRGLDRALRWSELPSPDLILLRARVARGLDPELARAGLEEAIARLGRVPAFVEELASLRLAPPR